MRSALIMASVVCLCAGCARQSDVQALQVRIQSLEGLVSADQSLQDSQAKQIQNIETGLLRLSSANSGQWILWAHQEGFNTGYPVAQSAFQTQSDCFAARNGYGFSDKRGFHTAKVLGSGDPLYISMNGATWKLACLPKGVPPIAR